MPRADLARAIFSKAREYLGAPLARNGRSRKGLDCLGLLLCVGEDLDLRDAKGVPILRSDYPHVVLRPSPAMMNQLCSERLEQRTDGAIEPGDVLTFRTPRETAHLAIVSDLSGHLGMIRCEGISMRCVVEHRIDDAWRWRIHNVFSVPEQK